MRKFNSPTVVVLGVVVEVVVLVELASLICCVGSTGGRVVRSGTEKVPLTTLLVVTTDTMASPINIELGSSSSAFSVVVVVFTVVDSTSTCRLVVEASFTTGLSLVLVVDVVVVVLAYTHITELQLRALHTCLSIDIQTKTKILKLQKQKC